EYVVNVGTIALQMARYGRAFGLDHDTHSVAVYIQNTGVEFSGRDCAGINEINFKAMAESVSITHENLDFDSAFCQVETLGSKILEVVSASPGENLKDVYRIIALLSEASRLHTAESYIYGDAGWVYSAQQAILEGWNSILSPDYVSSLEVVLDIDLSALDGNVQAFDVLTEVYLQLSLKHIDGFWTGLLLHDRDMTPLGNPNREGWELGASLAGITPDFIRDTFGLEKNSTKNVDIEDLVGVNCFDDIEDLVYLAESFGMVHSITTNQDGSVKGVTLLTDPEVESCKVIVCDV
ncbi:unnamed protein product, partial [Pylaiella littoralis]